MSHQTVDNKSLVIESFKLYVFLISDGVRCISDELGIGVYFQVVLQRGFYASKSKFSEQIEDQRS
ncbi:MAG: hypothetical protein ACERKD_23505 [Prolixibacteraceae bacterium]